MHLFIVGLNHTTAPIALREKVAFSDDQLESAIRHIQAIRHIVGVVILSTCNRTEFYLSVEWPGELGSPMDLSHSTPIAMSLVEDSLREPQNSLNTFVQIYDSIVNFLAEIKDVDKQQLNASCYFLNCEKAVFHAFRVASSLDSLVVGERQILSQFKHGYDFSLQRNATGSLLNKLCQTAINVGKRARSETKIGVGAVSVSQAAVELCGEIFADLSNKKVAIIGAGEMAELAAVHLQTKKPHSIVVVNRSAEKAALLAGKFQARSASLDSLATILVESDVVFTATSSPEPIITRELFAQIHKKRKDRTLLLVDLALPRDVDASINSYDNVFLYEVDDLKIVVEKNLDKRKSEIVKVEKIIQEEYENYVQWYSKLNILPVIQQLKTHLETIRLESMDQFVRKERKGGRELENMEVIEKVSSKIIGKIIKEIMAGTQKCKTNRDWREYSQKLVDIFGLESKIN